MGYESKLYVIRKSCLSKDECGLRFAEKIAEINLCCGPEWHQVAKCYPETDSYIYADDGNSKITEDRYGDKLTEIPLASAIKILEEAYEHTNYRRYKIALGLLKSFEPDKWIDEVVVLHYGY